MKMIVSPLERIEIMEAILKFMEDLFLTNGIVIAVGCFVLGEIIKHTLNFIPNQYIPLISGIAGLSLGVFVPSIMPETHPVIRAIEGLALGWAATGGVETVKKLKESICNKQKENEQEITK